MPNAPSLFPRLPLLVSGVAALMGLTGCTLRSGIQATSLSEGTASLSGTVHGGRQPISGSRIYMFAAGTGGYGTASTSLLLPGAGVSTDTSGNNYVTSDANGNFSITGDYLCTVGTQVYLYASGGTASPGDGANPAVGLLAGLGQCPSTPVPGTFLTSIPNIIINEVTTIATAYSLAGFATDPTHIASRNTTMSTTGIANAMANVANIVNIGSGQALTIPASIGTTTCTSNCPAVPVNKINLLADILAACINGASGNSACGTLFSNITSNGTTGGTVPADTATAAIYMAKNQWNAPAAIFSLATANSPFTTTLTTATDLAVPVQYSYGGAGGGGVVTDASGNIYSAVGGNTTLYRYTPQGAQSTAPASPGPQNLAIDSTGNVWVALATTSGTNANTIAVYSPGPPPAQITGSPYNPQNAGVQALKNPYAVAFDASGNAYIPNASGTYVTEISSSGTFIASSAVGSAAKPEFTAVAKNGDVWAANNGTNVAVTYFPGANLASPTQYSITGCGATTGQTLVTDSSSNAWVSCATGVAKVSPAGAVTTYFTANRGGSGLSTDSSGNVFQNTGATGTGLNEFNSSGTMLTSAAGYTLPAAQSLFNAVDISGNVWSSANKLVVQFLGMASPTAAPISPNNVQTAP